MEFARTAKRKDVLVITVKSKLIKTFSTIVLALAIGLSFCGCDSLFSKKEDDGKISIVCTIFPEYDWLRNIIGDGHSNIELTLLIDDGADVHGFQPSTDDIVKISTCDMFVYVGGESSTWVDDAIANVTNKDMVIVDVVDAIGQDALEEEIVEGMQVEEHGDHDEEGHDGETEFDEHVWLSLSNAQIICATLVDELCALDPDNAPDYRLNESLYVEELQQMDAAFREVCGNSARNTIVVGDRFPFRYLVNDYGIEYYAAFVGCSSDTQASFETIAFLASKVDELNLPWIIELEGSTLGLAQTIIDSSASGGQEIIYLNSMEFISDEDIQNGVTYVDIMQSNLDALQIALN